MNNNSFETHVPVMNVSCPLCDQKSLLKFSSGPDFDYQTTGDQIFFFDRCIYCDILYLNPRPTCDSLKKIYSKSDYYSYKFSQKINRIVSYARLKRDSSKVKGVLNILKDYKSLDEVKVLDVGSGDGSLLRCFKSYGVRSENLYGIEINRDACDAIEGLGFNSICGQVEDIELGQNIYNCISLIQVIEHIADPIKLLQKIHNSMLLNGVLIIETPNFDSWDQFIFSKSSWGGYHFPRHWVLWNKKSIIKTLESAGFRIEKISTPAAAVTWIWSINHLMQINYGASKLADYFKMTNLFLLGIFWIVDIIPSWLGHSSNIRIIASRVER